MSTRRRMGILHYRLNDIALPVRYDHHQQGMRAATNSSQEIRIRVLTIVTHAANSASLLTIQCSVFGIDTDAAACVLAASPHELISHS